MIGEIQDRDRQPMRVIMTEAGDCIHSKFGDGGPASGNDKTVRKSCVEKPEIGAPPAIVPEFSARIFLLTFHLIDIHLMGRNGFIILVPTRLGERVFLGLNVHNLFIQFGLQMLPDFTVLLIPFDKIGNGEAEKPDAIIDQQSEQAAPYPWCRAHSLVEGDEKQAKFLQIHRHISEHENRCR